MHRFNDIELDKADGAGVKIAIIDSGVAAGHPHLAADAVAAGVTIVGDSVSADFGDRLGHGTAVAAAIHEKAPAARLLIARVFITRLAGSPEALVRAVEWSITQGAHLINLSLGTSNPAHEALLSDVIATATSAGAIIVAAGENHGVRWLPGCIPGALGVLADPGCARHELRTVDVPARVAASPQPRPIAGIPIERNLSGVSFAVANATGIIALLTGAGHGEVLRKLIGRDDSGISHTSPPLR
ncbi:MAG: S8 family serine peptidase [Gemmatimonadota bacterium]